MPPDRTLRILLTRTRVKRVIVAVALANVLMIAGTYIANTLIGSDTDWRLNLLAQQFSLALENNFGAWYSSALLLAVGAAMLGCFALDSRAHQRPAGGGGRAHLLTYGWLALAILFVGLSLDELGSLHERLDQFSLRNWAELLAAPILLIGLLMVAFAWLRVRQSRAAFVAMGIGVLLFLTVPMQELYESVQRAESGLGGDYRRPLTHALFEEGAEVFGSLGLLSAALLFARIRVSGGAEPTAIVRIAAWAPALLALALVGGLAIAHFGLPSVLDLDQGHRGDPRNWFPAASGAIAAALCLHLSRAGTTSRRWSAWPLALLGLLNLAFSIDHGSDHRYSEWLFSERPMLALARDLAIGAAVAGTALLLWMRVRSGDFRAGLASWAILLLVTLPAGATARSIGATVGYLALTLGLVTLLPLHQETRAAEVDPGTVFDGPSRAVVPLAGGGEQPAPLSAAARSAEPD